ncbi:MAG TPA: RNA methyltransferase [Blastocatellia bacterium]|nr:RNA methyltransferase [Blastocatellia bacterium]
MLVEKITSRQNPLVKRFRRVRVGSERHLVFIEGVRLVEDALRAGAHFESVAYTATLEANERGLALLDELQQVPCRGAHVSKQVMEAICDTQNPQGIAAIVSRPHFELDDLFASEPQIIVIADQLQDPGNLGTIIRTAEAAGANGLVTTRYTVDPFNQKALRASMGSALRLPVVTDIERDDVVKQCRERGIKLLATQPQPARPQGVIEDAAKAQAINIYTDADFTVPFALIFGSEASGLSDDAASAADEFVYIPMAAQVESLNVAAAAAVLLYEAARQREFRGQESVVGYQGRG